MLPRLVLLSQTSHIVSSSSDVQSGLQFLLLGAESEGQMTEILATPTNPPLTPPLLTAGSRDLVWTINQADNIVMTIANHPWTWGPKQIV
jgi:hypothetical protein